MLIAVAIAAVVVAGAISYLVVARREEQKRMSEARDASNKLFREFITAVNKSDVESRAEAERIRAEIDAIRRLPDRERARAIVERARKRWPEE